MITDIDTLFPKGLSDETVCDIAEVLNVLASQWESHYFQRIRTYQAQQQLDLFDPDEPWRRRAPDW